ncbi:flagellar protein FliT [Brevibacillus fluminis]|uniref:flagellar protein FliT n=1 Tax=Brevibacillus fluminis TaxID=511487 RepID=UPI003F88FA50
MEERLNRLLKLTETLQEHVLHKRDEPDLWVQILDEREQVVQELQAYSQFGHSLHESHQQMIGKVLKIDEQLRPVIEAAKKEVGDQINRMERSKLAKKQYAEADHYGGYDDYGYSHFFDQKK